MSLSGSSPQVSARQARRHTNSVSRAHYTVKTESAADVVFLKYRSRTWLLHSQSLTEIGFLY